MLNQFARRVNGGASITLLTPTDNRDVGKRLIVLPDGSFLKGDDPRHATFFRAVILPCRTLDRMLAILRGAASRNFIVVHGIPDEKKYIEGLPGTAGRRMRRKWKNPDEAALFDQARPYIVLDLDGVDTPLLDGEGVASVARALLPPRFHDVRCIWNLTRSHGIAERSARIRLIFWVDRPISLEETKAILEEKIIVEENGERHVRVVRGIAYDASVQQIGQPVYLGVHVEGAPDPFPNRWGLLEGTPHVEAPSRVWFDAQAELSQVMDERHRRKLRELREAERAARRAARNENAKQKREKGGAKSVELEVHSEADDDDDISLDDRALLGLGDGDGRGGFHKPLNRLIAKETHGTLRKGEQFNPEKTRRELTLAIRAAPISEVRRKGAGKSPEQYIDELPEWIERISSGIIADHERRMKEAKLAELSPAVPFEDAYAIIREAAARALAGPQQTFQAVDDDVDDDDAAELSFLVGGGGGMTHLLRATVGLGKTREIVSTVKDAVAQGKRVAYVCPMHKLAREAQARFVEAGLNARIWLGMDRPHPDDDQTKICRFSDLLPAAFRCGASAADICDKCEFRTTCYYPNQSIRNADVCIFAGPAFLHSIPDRAREADRTPAFDLVVIDEMPVTAFAQEKPLVVSKADLFDPLPEQLLIENRANGDKALRAFAGFEKIFECSARVTFLDVKAAFPNWSVKMWDGVRRLLYGARVPPRLVVEVMRKGSSGKREKTPSEVHNERIDRLLRLCATMSLVERESRPRDIENETPRLRVKDGAIHVLGRRAIHDDWRPSTKIMLDATADPKLTELCVGPLESVTDVRVEAGPVVRVRQVDASFSYGYLGIVEGAPPRGDDIATVKKRHKRLRRFIETLPGILREEIGVIGPKALLEPKDANGVRIAGAGLLDGMGEHVLRAWFGGLRGLDAMKDVRQLVVVSRPLPRTEEIERIAESLTGDAIRHATEWTRRPVLKRTVDGVRPVERLEHPNRIAERVRRAVCDAEVIQAIGRARWVRRSGWRGMLDVWVLSDVVLDDFEVETVQPDEWKRLAGPAQRLLSAGVVPERRGRKALISALTGTPARTLDRVLAEDAPEGWRADKWFEGERQDIETLGASRWQTTTVDGSCSFVWIAGVETVEQAKERLARFDCAVELEAAPPDGG